VPTFSDAASEGNIARAAADGETMPPEQPERNLGRILEVGEHCLVGRGLPARTNFVCTSITSPPPDLPAELRILDAVSALRALRSNAYDLVIAHAPAYALWQAPVVRSLVRRPIRRGPTLMFRSFLSRVVPAHIPVVMLDMEDAPIIQPSNLPLLDRAILCFKRELPADRARAFLRMRAPTLPTPSERGSAPLSARMCKLRPISIGVSAKVMAAAPERPAQKTADIFFAGHIAGSSTVRDAGLQELNALSGRGVRVDSTTDRLELGDYLRRAAAAHLVWSPEGLGQDCFRHYEAAACWSVPVISAPGIERYQPLRHGIHALYYPVERGGLARTTLCALREPGRLSIMGRAGRRHVLRHHTHAALAQYVLGETARELAAVNPRGR
jgi:hypothetical protein